MSKSQETAFVEGEADRFFERNYEASISPVGGKNEVIQAICSLEMAQSGKLIDLGGGSGRISAAFGILYPEWDITVVDASLKSINAGKKYFKDIKFRQKSISDPQIKEFGKFDLVILSFVLTWIDRSFLSQVVANADSLVKDKGYIVINDFSTQYNKTVPYHHLEGLLTYKQDYAKTFLGLGTFFEIYRMVTQMESDAPEKLDDYQSMRCTSILRKDLKGLYSPSKLID